MTDFAAQTANPRARRPSHCSSAPVLADSAGPWLRRPISTPMCYAPCTSSIPSTCPPFAGVFVSSTPRPDGCPSVSTVAAAAAKQGGRRAGWRWRVLCGASLHSHAGTQRQNSCIAWVHRPGEKQKMTQLSMPHPSLQMAFDTQYNIIVALHCTSPLSGLPIFQQHLEFTPLLIPPAPGILGSQPLRLSFKSVLAES